MARVTVKTIAEAVGVSPSTVSNAYNRPDQLSAELRERILAVAAELGYAGPDAAARMLRSGRAEAVGVLLTERLSYAFSDPYAIGFLTALTEVLERSQTSLVLMPIGYESQRDLGDHEPDLTAVRQANIDAMTILCIGNLHPATQLARARGIRIVDTAIDPEPTSSWVAIDDVEAGALVGRHLAELGHHRVGSDCRHRLPGGDGHHRPDHRRHHLHRLSRPAPRPGSRPRRSGDRFRRPQHRGFGHRRRRSAARPSRSSDGHRRTQRRGRPRESCKRCTSVV